MATFLDLIPTLLLPRGSLCSSFHWFLPSKEAGWWKEGKAWEPLYLLCITLCFLSLHFLVCKLSKIKLATRVSCEPTLDHTQKLPSPVPCFYSVPTECFITFLLFFYSYRTLLWHQAYTWWLQRHISYSKIHMMWAQLSSNMVEFKWCAFLHQAAKRTK